jgi:hypothetical protein
MLSGSRLAGALQEVCAAKSFAGKMRRMAAEKYSDAAQRLANQHELAMEFFVGLGNETEKQADRAWSSMETLIRS